LNLRAVTSGHLSSLLLCGCGSFDVKVLLDVVEGELLVEDEAVEVGVDAVAVGGHKRVKLGHHGFHPSLDGDPLGKHKLEVRLHLLLGTVETEEDLWRDADLLLEGLVDVGPEGVLLETSDEEVLDD
jgi:hypothetical protein